VKVRVVSPPPFHQDDGERVAESQCADRDQYSEDLGSEPGCGPAAELVKLDTGNCLGAGGHQGALPCSGRPPICRNLLVIDAQGFPQMIMPK
jgi:hypothetical protein